MPPFCHAATCFLICIRCYLQMFTYIFANFKLIQTYNDNTFSFRHYTVITHPFSHKPMLEYPFHNANYGQSQIIRQLIGTFFSGGQPLQPNIFTPNIQLTPNKNYVRRLTAAAEESGHQSRPSPQRQAYSYTCCLLRLQNSMYLVNGYSAQGINRLLVKSCLQ